jgi:uncharacterized protein DUF4328
MAVDAEDCPAGGASPPAATPPAPVAGLEPVGALGVVTVAMLAGSCLASVAPVRANWRLYEVVLGYERDWTVVTRADLLAADTASDTARTPQLIMLFLTAVVVMFWLGAARRNAERCHPADHHLGRGAVVGGWFLPVVNLWLPYQVVDDVWRTSDPAAPRAAVHARELPRSGLVVAWWLCLVAAAVVWWWSSSGPTLTLTEIDPAQFHELAIGTTATAVLLLAAAVLLAVVVYRISTWQSRRRATS